MKQNKNIKNEAEIVYDRKYDILIFKQKGKIYKKSIEFQNFVFDFDTEGSIMGVRIFDASKTFDVEQDVLANIRAYYFKAQVEKNIISIQLRFTNKEKKLQERISQQIMTEAPYVLTDSSIECVAG